MLCCGVSSKGSCIFVLLAKQQVLIHESCFFASGDVETAETGLQSMKRLGQRRVEVAVGGTLARLKLADRRMAALAEQAAASMRQLVEAQAGGWGEGPGCWHNSPPYLSFAVGVVYGNKFLSEPCRFGIN